MATIPFPPHDCCVDRWIHHGIAQKLPWVCSEISWVLLGLSKDVMNVIALHGPWHRLRSLLVVLRSPALATL